MCYRWCLNMSPDFVLKDCGNAGGWDTLSLIVREVTLCAPFWLSCSAGCGRHTQFRRRCRYSPRPVRRRAQDGGTREVLESIAIPPLVNAPFTGTLVTEWTRPMADGGTYTLTNHRRIARDSAGRIYEERWLLVPKGSGIESHMNFIQIADPINRTLYTCSIFHKTCDLSAYRPAASAAFEDEPPPPPGRSKDGTHTVENLGTRESLRPRHHRHPADHNPSPRYRGQRSPDTDRVGVLALSAAWF